jgi:hypothetical protein
LVTAADGAEKFYTLENNGIRIESVEEAREVDARTCRAWIGHPKLFVFGTQNQLAPPGRIRQLSNGALCQRINRQLDWFRRQDAAARGHGSRAVRHPHDRARVTQVSAHAASERDLRHSDSPRRFRSRKGLPHARDGRHEPRLLVCAVPLAMRHPGVRHDHGAVPPDRRQVRTVVYLCSSSPRRDEITYVYFVSVST